MSRITHRRRIAYAEMIGGFLLIAIGASVSASDGFFPIMDVFGVPIAKEGADLFVDGMKGLEAVDSLAYFQPEKYWDSGVRFYA